MPERLEEFESMALLDTYEHEHDVYRDPKKDINWKTRPTKTTIVMVSGLAAFFLLDIVAFAYVALVLIDASRLGMTDNLEFKNPFFGLDELYSLQEIKTSSYDPIVNEPRFATQIDQSRPEMVFPVDLHRWLSDFGVLSPPDRNFKVSSTIHTIVQFHVLDYGMEKCSLGVRLPRRQDILPHPISLPATGDIVSLDICELSVSRPLKEGTLSWSTRPSCSRKLGTLDGKIGGEVNMEPFFCKSGSFIAYQVSCAKGSPGCDVDVWTNQNATWGVYLNQYQTT